MKLTEVKIKETIEKGNKYILSVYPEYRIPKFREITIKDNSEMHLRWAEIAKCNIQDTYRLKINQIFEEFNNDRAAEKSFFNCIIHELLHTLTMRHDGEFLRLSNLLNKKYPELYIRPNTPFVEFEHFFEDKDIIPQSEKNLHDYVVICPTCGTTHYYSEKDVRKLIKKERKSNPNDLEELTCLSCFICAKLVNGIWVETTKEERKAHIIKCFKISNWEEYLKECDKKLLA